jgi:hypothetical protein
LDRTRSLILQMLVERLRSDPERALPYAQTLQSMDPTDEQAALELRSLDTSARGSAMRSANARVGQPNGGHPDAYFALNEQQRSQQIHYCRSPDGVQIAYAISGKGPPILRAAHWMSHLQYEWESPVWRHWIDSLSKGNTPLVDFIIHLGTWTFRASWET